jgi:hypothetical protein
MSATAAFADLAALAAHLRSELEENKAYFGKILNNFRMRYPFNPELFPDVSNEAGTL